MKKSFKSNYLDFDNRLTPEYFKSVASAMENDGVEFLEVNFDAGYNNVSIEEFSFREETKEEKDKRLQEEKIAKTKEYLDKEKEKRKLILKSQKLGIKVSSDPLMTNYKNIYWVVKGTEIDNFVAPYNGYIWYDEVGQLGTNFVYTTALAAVKALNNYAEQL